MSRVCGSLEGCATADDYFCEGKRSCRRGAIVTLGQECVSGVCGGAGAWGYRGPRVCELAMERLFLEWGGVWPRRGGCGGVSSGVCVPLGLGPR